MSWNVEMPLIVRSWINDLSDTPTYSDERVQQLIVVAAQYVIKEVDLKVVIAQPPSTPISKVLETLIVPLNLYIDPLPFNFNTFALKLLISDEADISTSSAFLTCKLILSKVWVASIFFIEG